MHQTDITIAPALRPKSVPSPRPIRGIDDWPLPFLIMLDQAAPGFLSRIMQSGDLRRQAIFAALAQGLLDDTATFLDRVGQNRVLATCADEPLARVAAVLLHARAREIVTATFGACPRHLLAILRRLGEQPFPLDAYGRLCRLTAEPAATARVSYLLGRDTIFALDLDKAEQLRPEVLASKLAQAIHSVAEIARVNTVVGVALQASSTLTPERLAQSLADLGDKVLSNEWLHRLIEQFDRLLVDAPFSGDAEAVLLATGAAILNAGRQYRNCLKTMLHDTLAGHSYFYEFPKYKVIAHVKMLSDSTGFVEGVYGKGNGFVPDKVKLRVRDRLQHFGLPSIYDSRDRPDLKVVANLPAPWRFRDIDDEDGE